LTEFSSP